MTERRKLLRSAKQSPLLSLVSFLPIPPLSKARNQHGTGYKDLPMPRFSLYKTLSRPIPSSGRENGSSEGFSKEQESPFSCNTSGLPEPPSLYPFREARIFFIWFPGYGREQDDKILSQAKILSIKIFAGGEELRTQLPKQPPNFS